MNKSLSLTINRIKNSRRQSPASVKTRGQVSGGGRKPFRQKGTGNARAGSIRSPLWRGGGKSFGPQNNKNYQLRQNKKEIKSVINTLISNIKPHLFTSEDLKKIGFKTKNAAKFIEDNKLFGQILFVYDDELQKTKLAFQNIANLKAKHLSEINAYDFFYADFVLTKNKIWQKLQERTVNSS